MKAIGVHREQKLAGKPGSDQRILSLVGKELEKKNFQVELKKPDELTGNEEADLVFTMARSREARGKIHKIGYGKTVVVNKPEAVGDSLNRKLSYERLEEAGVRIPKTTIKSLEDLSFKDIHGKSILKRADRHEQWFIINNEKEFKDALEFYSYQSARKIAVQEFIPGDHVKFYVIGKKMVSPTGNIGELRKQALLAGKATDLEVYGGDFIVSDKPFLVDVNDWPSFGSVEGYAQEEAATTIAEYLAQKLEQTQ